MRGIVNERRAVVRAVQENDGAWQDLLAERRRLIDEAREVLERARKGMERVRR